jgi:hypothetical protein
LFSDSHLLVGLGLPDGGFELAWERFEELVLQHREGARLPAPREVLELAEVAHVRGRIPRIQEL